MTRSALIVGAILSALLLKVPNSLIETALAADAAPASAADAARDAWEAARVPDQQTEVYRFGNAIVDAWEGKVKAWILDDGLIDYVGTTQDGEMRDENTLYAANVIANDTATHSHQPPTGR